MVVNSNNRNGIISSVTVGVKCSGVIFMSSGSGNRYVNFPVINGDRVLRTLGSNVASFIITIKSGVAHGGVIGGRGIG